MKLLKRTLMIVTCICTLAANGQEKKKTDERAYKKSRTEKAPTESEIEKEKERILEERARQTAHVATPREGGDMFPKGTVWLNTDGPLALNNFDHKITLIVVTDPENIECNYYLSSLQDELITYPAIQIIQAIKGDEAQPLRRSSLLQYVQMYGYSHPIAVVPDFSGFSTHISDVPFFMLYEKKNTPAFASGGYSGYEALKQKLKEITSDKALLQTCYNYQIQPAVLHNWYADPLIENPVSVATDDESDRIFVNDFAHNRIVELDGAGTCIRSVGSGAKGFSDDFLANSRFDHPHDALYYMGKLFVADTYNHRIRVCDFSTERVYTICGNGRLTFEKAEIKNGLLDPFGLPNTLTIFNKKLYAASAATNQVFEIDIKSGKCTKFIDLPGNLTLPYRKLPVSMAAVGNYLYISMSDGSLVKADESGNIVFYAATPNIHPGRLCSWKNTLVTTDIRTNQLFKYGKKGWEVIAGDGSFGNKNGVAHKANFSQPMGMGVLNGLLLIADCQNHSVRTLSALKKGKVKTLPQVPDRVLIGETAAHTFGENVVMDTIYVSRKESKVRVSVDAGEYKIIPEWSNADIDEVEGAYLVKTQIEDETFEFAIRNTFEGMDAYLEVYLLLEHPDVPGQYLVKRSYLSFYIERVEIAQAVQEQVYKVNVLPY